MIKTEQGPAPQNSLVADVGMEEFADLATGLEHGEVNI